MNTTTASNRMRRVARGVVLAAATALIGLGAPAVGHADPGPAAGPGMGCETIQWGAFGSARRKVCDGPQQPDGTWQRTRTIWLPAYYATSTCLRNVDSDDDTSERRLVDCGGHWVPESISDQETYPVAPDTVLPDEPGWLPPYTDNIL
jgi:hypothetical protein